MNETERLLRRQAEWQRERRDLSWPDKIRQAERVRSSVAALRRRPSAVVPSQQKRAAAETE